MASRMIPAFVFPPAAVLRLSGEDHAGFLQGQGTQDLRGAPGWCRYNLWLDHRGIIHGDATVLRPDEGHMLLVSHACPAAELVGKFSRHIIADDVVIEDRTAGHALAAVPAEHAQALLDTLGASAPGADTFITTGPFTVFAGRRLGQGSLELLVPASAELPLAGTITEAQAELLRIRAGMPLAPRDTAGLNPVEAGLTGAVSFTKGCYLGQEVVARVHRLQRAGRHLVRLEGGGPPPSAPVPLLRGGAEVGALTSVVEIPGGFLGIGWLKGKVADGEQRFDRLDCSVRSLLPL